MTELQTGKLYLAALALAAAGAVLSTSYSSIVLVVAAAGILFSMAFALVLLALFTWHWQRGAAGMNVYRPQDAVDLDDLQHEGSGSSDEVLPDGDALAG